MPRKKIRWSVNRERDNKCDTCGNTATHLMHIDQPQTSRTASYSGTYPRCKSHGRPKYMVKGSYLDHCVSCWWGRHEECTPLLARGEVDIICLCSKHNHKEDE